MTTVQPFIKWVGGKQRLVKTLPLPPSFTRYVEPFLGGGAMYWYIKSLYPDMVCQLADVNNGLITCYQVIKQDVLALIHQLEIHERNHNKGYYYAIRETTYSDPVDSAAQFIYLNKTCFNGLYRVNQQGKFNVPIGDYRNHKICDKEGLLAASAVLQNRTNIFSSSALKLYISEGDFIYLDPPYHGCFNQYHHVAFTESDHYLLAKLCNQWKDNGVYIMVSNSDTELVRELYRGWVIKEVQVARAINSNPKGRKPVTELVITNY